jgi:hypothetical protein
MPVSIVGRAERLDFTEFERRRNAGIGRFITAEEIKRRGVFETSQTLWNALGTRIVWNGHDNVVYFTRPVGTGRSGGPSLLAQGINTAMPKPKGVSQPNAGPGGYNTLCAPAYWLDGFPIPGDVNEVVRPAQVHGIEVYVDPSAVPAEYRLPNVQCGVVLIWTKASPPKKLEPPKH